MQVYQAAEARVGLMDSAVALVPVLEALLAILL
jgi:hypothetical protein